jgi:hypothetical protein
MNTTIQPASAITRALPISGWEEFLQEGEAYLKTGHGAHARGKKAFTPEILYNIIAMAIEKLVMAALMQRGALPYNHTMGDLVEAMETVFPAEIAGLKVQLLDLDRYQEICDIDAFKIRPPTPAEIPSMLALAEDLRQLVRHLVIITEGEPA